MTVWGMSSGYLRRELLPCATASGKTGFRRKKKLAPQRLNATLFEVRGFGTTFDPAHGFKNGLQHRLIPHRGVQHDVVEGPGRPVGIDVERMLPTFAGIASGAAITLSRAP